MYLFRFNTDSEKVVYDINPLNGTLVSTFPENDEIKRTEINLKQGWARYGQNLYLVYSYENKWYFHINEKRYEINHTFTVKHFHIFPLWRRFSLYKNGEKIFSTIYRDPQSRLKSLFAGLLYDDDYWDWETPFSAVKEILNGLAPSR